MLMKSVFQSILLSAALVCATSSFAADDPNIKQIYEAANSGHLDEAQTMIQKVLTDHPDSAKAHYVDAEILAKQGRYDSAQAELNNADRLAPGLPFAKADSVENLRRIIANGTHGATRPAAAANFNHAPASPGFPWGMIFIVVAVIGFIVFAMKFMGNRTQPVYMQNGGAPGFGSGMPGQPYGGMPGPMMGGGPGIGSGIVGGLVTGAAVGAGIVAGEELMHHFTDGDRNNVVPQQDNYSAPPVNDNMGGSDFGISDSSSWDSGGGGGGGDSGGDW
jgi:uncharacterized membrane protein YgcG